MSTSLNQATIGRSIRVDGIGLHGGLPVTVVISPALAGTGIVISRDGRSPTRVTAERVDRVPLCTRFRTEADTIDTIEHMMAALAIMGIDNAAIDVSGPEVPILDGSAEPWAAAIIEAGVVHQDEFRTFLEVTRPFAFRMGDSSYEALPGKPEFDVAIEFNQPVGRQRIAFDRRDAATLLDARTFTFETELAWLRQAGLGRGGSLDNAIVVGADGPLNPEGLRGQDEFVRHKALDLVGDLYVAGYRVKGRIKADKPGHAANNAFLTAMIAEGVLRSTTSPIGQPMAA